MNIGELKEPRRLSFKSKFGKYYGHLIDPEFLLGRDPYEEPWLSPTKKPFVNIKKNKSYYELEIPVPGWEKKDISVEIEGDFLVVKGARDVDQPEDETEYIVREHFMDEFERRFQLSSITDKEKIVVYLKNGMLRILLYHVQNGKDVKSKKLVIQGS